MQIDRTAVTAKRQGRACCPLDCSDCSGLCLAIYMMLTPAEQDAVARRPHARLN